MVHVCVQLFNLGRDYWVAILWYWCTLYLYLQASRTRFCDTICTNLQCTNYAVARKYQNWGESYLKKNYYLVNQMMAESLNNLAFLFCQPLMAMMVKRLTWSLYKSNNGLSLFIWCIYPFCDLGLCNGTHMGLTYR